MYVLLNFVMCLLVQTHGTQDILSSYKRLRSKILKEENLLSLGGRITLTDEEHEANKILMKLKQTEYDNAFHRPEIFNFSKHYFTYKDHIQTSKVYQIIQKMPKGSALHLHNSFMLDADSLIELTYEDHLYACYHSDLRFYFSIEVPTLPCPVEWTLLSALRDSSENVADFDSQLKKHLTIITDTVDLHNIDINLTWKKFETVNKVITSLIAYRPVREKFFNRILEMAYEDNVMYLELRSGLGTLYELNGTEHDSLFIPRLYRILTNSFISKHPDFIGFKIILSAYRAATDTKIKQALNLAKQFKKELPDIFAGFDLVGQEDLGRPLLDFVPLLEKTEPELDYYFHAGETSWFGTSTDENLVDAILMGTKRIGHAYSLLKHPRLLKYVIEKDIALEVNVISNAVLCLVTDVRNHPLATFLALGVPVVLSSDDPGPWGAELLSHDFYVAFVGVASRNYDLRLLKQLAINSINYSALNDAYKTTYFEKFNKRWNMFIKEVISQKGLGVARKHKPHAKLYH